MWKRFLRFLRNQTHLTQKMKEAIHLWSVPHLPTTSRAEEVLTNLVGTLLTNLTWIREAALVILTSHTTLTMLPKQFWESWTGSTKSQITRARGLINKSWLMVSQDTLKTTDFLTQ